MTTEHRKLATIMFTDMVGYSALTQKSERLALELLDEQRSVLRGLFAKHGGREIEAVGDGFFVEFASALQATECAIEIQQALQQRNRGLPAERHILVRIGLHLGDVVVRGGSVHGDGVNIAARIEPLAEPGGICLSEDVARQIQNKIELPLRKLGKGELKNIRMPVDIYRLVLPWERRQLPISERIAFGLRQRRTRRLVGAGLALVLLALVSVAVVIQASRARVAGLPQKPSIAVLPFTNLSGAAAQDYFVDGLVEDVITQLSHFRDLIVIARNSTFKYRGKAVDAQQVGRELGARYVLEGSVRASKERVRITVQLIDATTGGHVWAKTYDEPLKEVFAVQDEVTKQVVGALGVSIRGSELERALRKSPGDLTAYDLVLQAGQLWSEGSAVEHLRVRTLLERAARLDPKYPRAQAMLAFAYLDEYRWNYNRTVDRPDPLGSALAAAELAVRLDPPDAYSHYALAKVLFYAKDLTRFEEEVRKTLMLNPNFADAKADFAIRFANMGRLDDAVAMTRDAMRLNPLYPGWYHFTFFVEAYLRGEYERAIEETKKINWPNSHWTYYNLAVANGQLGRMKEARAAVKQLLKLAPDFRRDVHRQLDDLNQPPHLKNRWLDGLRKAGFFDTDAGTSKPAGPSPG
jgi:adenylate cyclase